MNVHLLRLESSIKNGVGGPGAGLIDLLYTFLLQEYGFNRYNYIHIHQIGDDLNELILKEGKAVYINIRYKVDGDFIMKSIDEKNIIRLDLAHQALLKLAEQDKNIEVAMLEQVKSRIIEKKFNLEFIFKEVANKKIPHLVGKVIIAPCISDFKFYADIFDNGIRKCRLLIYKGATVPLYFNDLFSLCKWKGLNQFIVSGKKSEIDIQINSDNCRIEYINKTEFKNRAPLFELLKSDADKEKTLQDYISSSCYAKLCTLTLRNENA